MKFKDRVKLSACSGWESYCISYNNLENILESGRKEINRLASRDQKELALSKANNTKDTFFQAVHTELDIVTTFFNNRLDGALSKFKEIKQQTYILCKYINVLPTNYLALDCNIRSNNRESQSISKKSLKIDKKYRKSYKSLELAISEFYVLLNYLKNYKNINFIGFKKILKLFDKTFTSSEGQQFRINFIEKSDFYLNHQIEQIQLEIESIYINVFANSSKSKGMANLRIPSNEKNKKIEKRSFLLGFFLSGCIILICLTIKDLFHVDVTFNHRPQIISFSGQLMPILYIIFSSVYVYGWREHAVNYVLLLELDPRYYSDNLDCLCAGFFLLFIWLFFVYLYVNKHIFNILPIMFPIASFIVFWILLFLPVNLFYRSSRKWIGIIILRNLLTPMYKVRFQDNWLYDQFVSFSQPFVDLLSYTPCMIAKTALKQDVHFCETPNFFLNLIIAQFPFYIRSIQCVRRFYDFHKEKKTKIVNLFNSMKYGYSIFVSIVYFAYSLRNVKTETFFWIYFCLKILSILYFLYFDIFIDWAPAVITSSKTCKPTVLELRLIRVFPHKYLYYLAIIQNIIIRFLNIYNPLASRYLSHLNPCLSLLIRCLIDALEIYRRCIWTIFRVENEHIGYVFNGKVIRDIAIVPVSMSNRGSFLVSSNHMPLCHTFDYREPVETVTECLAEYDNGQQNQNLNTY